MTTKFPQELDSDEELHKVQDDVDEILAEHHNVLKDAVIAVEKKVGINNSADPDSLDSKKLDSLPPDGFKKMRNAYFSEEDKELIINI